MEQRPLRLGDHVDDYCPRERRVTNHVIVALVEDAIRQTRCTTCDADHVYKGAKEPRRRKKDPALFDAVLAESANGAPVVAPQLARPEEAPAPAIVERNGSDAGVEVAPASEQLDNEDVQTTPPTDEIDEPVSLHRRLIRASLPRNGDDPPPPRPIPEFTMHQRPPQGRGRHFRSHGHGNHSNGNGGFNGNRSHGHGNGNSNGNSFGHGRSGNGSGRHGRHRGKRSR